jgi:hypothetical protein
VTRDEISAEPILAPQEANDLIRGWAQIFAPDDRAPWEFVCECGREECAERVRITLATFDLLRREHEPVLAPSHLRERARAARSRSVEVQEEAQAVRNQARHQSRRADRLAQSLPAGHYRLVIRGELRDETARAFEDMTVTPGAGTTVLSVHVRDQAHLRDVLTRVFDLGLTLLYVSSLSDAT